MPTIEQWRDELHRDLMARRFGIARFYAYYRGDHPLPWAPKEVRDNYRAMLRMARSNWCRLVVKATSERLRIVGLRFSESESGDTEAWTRYWQGNNLDRQSRLVHDAGLVTGRGFVMVWPSAGDGPPTITPEHPSQVIVAYDPGSRSRLAALKTFYDRRAERRFATVWTPEQVSQWSAPAEDGNLSSVRWEPWADDALGIAADVDNVLGEVPIIEFQADPDLVDEPMGELAGGVTDIQDRINKTILDRLVTSNFSSFKQRWVTGMEIPSDETGQPVEPFKAAVDRLWMAEDPEVRFGEFSAADLSGYIRAVEADIQHLAAVTRTPPHYLLGNSGAFPSGESLKATETGLVAKVLERRDSFTESWEDAMRLALRAEGDSRAEDVALAMIWKDPESRSLAEVVDGATKLASIGVPWRSVMEFIGYSPNEIERMDQQRSEDVADGLLAQLVAQPATPTTTTGSPMMGTTP